MFFSRICCKILHDIKYSGRYYSTKNPIAKSWDIISKDIPATLGFGEKPFFYPEHADIVIIGGGFIGSAVAYWLKTRAGNGLSVIVLEKDLTYKNVQRNVSLGTITQHFSLPENILLSQYGAEFLRKIKENLGDDVDIQYCPTGHLVLACEKYAEKLEQNVTTQKEYGLRNELLTTNEIRKKFPWINTDDIKLGCMSNESEGLFNSWALLKGLVKKSKELGTTYVNAEVTGFELEKQRDVLMEGITPGSYQRINKVIYKTPNNEEYSIKFAICVLAASGMSGDIAKLAKIGVDDGLLAIPLPIEQRECKVYSIEDGAAKTGLNTPIITDTSGLWLNRNKLDNNLIYGHVPLLTLDKKISEKEFYRNIIEPSLLNRFPDYKNIEMFKIASEVYDFNLFDNTGIVGPHPYHNNLYIAAGFGKQGCQHAPGIGRAIAELIIDNDFVNIDLIRFGFDRLFTDQPMIEFNIY